MSATLGTRYAPPAFLLLACIRLKGTGSYDSIEKWEPGMKEAIEKVRSSATAAGAPR